MWICLPATRVSLWMLYNRSSVDTRWWLLNVAGRLCCEFPRASVKHINHISRLYYLKMKTLLELARGKGLIWQGCCIGKSSNKSRIWTIGNFNLERNATWTLLLLRYVLRLTQKWPEEKETLQGVGGSVAMATCQILSVLKSVTRLREQVHMGPCHAYHLGAKNESYCCICY